MIALPPPFAVRAALPSDAAFEEALYRSSRDDLLGLDAAPDLVEQLLALQWQTHRTGLRHAFPDAPGWIVLRHGVPVAHFVAAATAPGWHLASLILLPQVQRQGLGRQIVRSLQRSAADAGLALTLRVAKSNTAARQLYASLGFQVQDESLVADTMCWRAN